MKLYNAKVAPNPRRVRIFLAEKGIEVERVDLNIRERENLTAEYLSVNPYGLLPCLELDDGTCIAESMAICRYVEETHPEPNLMGADALEKATIEMWSRRMEFDGLQRASGLFRNSFEGFAGRAVAGVPQRTEQVPAFAAQCRDMLDRFADMLDARLGEAGHVAGARFTVADITALCAVDFAEKLARYELRPGRVHLARWHEAVSARPSAQA